MESFESLGLPQPLYHAVLAMKFHTPTPIQAQAIPLILSGKDLLGSAQTGTGKTGAFGIPLIAHLMNHPQKSALVVTPTRELAAQVMGQLEALLGKKNPIKTALLIGGESMGKQFNQLRRQPRLFVGTPGRIFDHLERGTLNLRSADFLVLDETDRMLDMGFSIQIQEIIPHMSGNRQTVLFSATLPKNIMKLAQQYLKNPVSVNVSSNAVIAENIEQEFLRTSEAEKYPQLLSQLDTREGSIIVFVKTKHGTEKMAQRLDKEGHRVEAIHGDLRQHKRDRVIQGFRNKKYRILVATDVAARGLDIPHIEHVINYDLPQCPEDYVHRIGRTARAGAKGEAISLVSPADNKKWHAIASMLDPNHRSEEKKKPKPRRRNFSGRRGGRGASRFER